MNRPPPSTRREQRAHIVMKPEQLNALEKINRADATHIIGIDEVGIGALAGPIVVGGVVVPKGWSDPHVKDSKLLSFNQRAIALEIIRAQKFEMCTCFRWAADIDKEGVTHSLSQLTEGVALYLRRRFPSSIVVLDGNRPTRIDGSLADVVWLPKADIHVPAVSAASIVAKVARDTHMIEQHKLYPEWGFDHNVGYPSKQHREAIAIHGLCPIHRQSYGC